MRHQKIQRRESLSLSGTLRPALDLSATAQLTQFTLPQNISPTPMSASERQELVRNAVSFLSDPKVSLRSHYVHTCSTSICARQTQASPLTQRVQFLEAKGLTGAEIEEAMRLAPTNQSGPRAPVQPYNAGYGPVYGPAPYPGQMPPQQWDLALGPLCV